MIDAPSMPPVTHAARSDLEVMTQLSPRCPHELVTLSGLRWHLWILRCAQDRMNALLAEPPFPLARRLAAAVTLVALGVLWVPALPVSPMIALGGVCWCTAHKGHGTAGLLRRPP